MIRHAGHSRRGPRIAVVIPCYESARFVRSAVLGALRQTLAPIRVVVVDDGSTDFPREQIADLLDGSEALVLVSQPNQGVARARQAGVEHLDDVDYVTFLDADDVPKPQMLERLCSLLELQSTASTAWCLPSFIDERGAPTEDPSWAPRLQPRGLFGLAEVPLSDPLTSFASIFTLAGLVPSLAVIRRTTFVAAGGWDAAIGQGYEDTDLFLRLALEGEILLCPERLLLRRCHPNQSTTRADHHWLQEQRLRVKWRDFSGLDARRRKIVLTGWRLHDRQVAIARARSQARRHACEGRYMSAAHTLLGGGRLLVRSWFVHHTLSRRA